MSPKEISDILSATGIGEAVDLLFSMERKKVADILSVMTSDGRAKMWTSFSNRYDSIPIDTDRYLFVPRNISTTTQGLVDTKHKRSKTNSTASPSVASCAQGMGFRKVLETPKWIKRLGVSVLNTFLVKILTPERFIQFRVFAFYCYCCSGCGVVSTNLDQGRLSYDCQMLLS